MVLKTTAVTGRGMLRAIGSAYGRRPAWLAPLFVWILASTALWITISWAQSSPEWIAGGFKLRDESSDSAWQTIRLWEMWVIGPSTLWLMHVYPPLYDAIRYVLMQPEVSAGLSPSAEAVDARLYVVLTIAFGLTAMVVYLWVRDLTGSGWWALSGATLWSVVPASIAHMTLLSGYGLSITAMAVAFYLLYKFCRSRRNLYATGFLLALLIASLLRNVVQIHVFVILVVAVISFYWIGRPRRLAWLAINLVVVTLIAVWPARAFLLYSTFDVSTHTGYNRAGALWINPLDVPEPSEYPANLEANAVALSSGWNTQELLRGNYKLGAAANDLIIHAPLTAVQRAAQSLTITVPQIFRPVQVQWYNAILLKSGFQQSLDWLFSSWRLAVMIFGSLFVVLWDLGRVRSVAIVRRYGWFFAFWVLTAIPVVLSNRYWPEDLPEPTATEADRLRALIDVPAYVVMVLAASIVWRRLILPRLRKVRDRSMVTSG